MVKVPGASVMRKRDGKFRFKTHWINFVSRSAFNAHETTVWDPSTYFLANINGRTSFKSTIQFTSQPKGAGIVLSLDPVEAVQSSMTPAQVDQFFWAVQRVCAHMLDTGRQEDRDRFLADVINEGLCKTMLSKWTWSTTTVNDKGYSRTDVHTLLVHKNPITEAAHAIGERIPSDVAEALQLWNQYDGPPAEYPKHKSDTAILATTFGCASRQPFVPTAGMQILIDNDFFVHRIFDGIGYFITPEVERDQNRIHSAFQKVSGRPMTGASPFVDHAQQYDPTQLAAIDMMYREPISILTGLAGTGKSQTLSAFLTQCGSAGVIAPSHAARIVIQDKCADAGCTGIGFEVSQFLRFGLDVACGSDRTAAFLEAMGYEFVYETTDTEFADEDTRGKRITPKKVNKVTTLVFEEAGMHDLGSVSRIIHAAVALFPRLCRIIFCGDPKQLQSVERGSVLRDLINAGVPHTELTKNYRSGEALARNFSAIVYQRPQDITFDDTFVKVEVQQEDMQYVTNGKKEPKQLPLAKIVQEFIKDSASGEEPHIVAYMNCEVDAINNSIAQALGVAPRRKGDPVLKEGIKVIVEKTVTIAPAEEGGEPALNLLKSQMYTCVSIASIASTDPKANALPLVPVSKKAHTADDLENHVASDLGEAVDEIIYKVTLERWNSNGDQTSFRIPASEINTIFAVGYASTIYRMQGGQVPYLFCVAIPNCAFFDCEALYTNTSRSRRRAKCFARNGDMEAIARKKNRPPHCTQYVFSRTSDMTLANSSMNSKTSVSSVSMAYIIMSATKYGHSVNSDMYAPWLRFSCDIADHSRTHELTLIFSAASCFKLRSSEYTGTILSSVGSVSDLNQLVHWLVLMLARIKCFNACTLLSRRLTHAPIASMWQKRQKRATITRFIFSDCQYLIYRSMVPQPQPAAARAARAAKPAKAATVARLANAAKVAKAAKPATTAKVTTVANVAVRKRIKQTMIDQGEKTCNVCVKIKLLSEFHKQKNGVGGVKATCAECYLKKSARTYRLKHGEPRHVRRSSATLTLDIKNENKVCSKCQKRKGFEDFHLQARMRDGRSPMCTLCSSELKKQVANTKDGFIKNFVRSSRSHTRQLKLPGEHTLTHEDVVRKLHIQQDRCFIFGIPLMFQRFSHWQCSPEKLQGAENYSYENVVLTCLEANTQAQWTRAKAIEVMTHVEHPLSDDELAKIRAEMTKRNRWKTTTYKVQEHDGGYHCFYCESDKDTGEFKKSRTKCDKCTSQDKTKRKAVFWKIRFQKLLDCSKSSAAKRKREASTHTISRDDIVDMFVEQRGLCAYSQKRVSKTGNFQASIERLDSTKGYTRANCVIVCLEFNSMDNSVRLKDTEDDKIGGWSRQKYLFVRSQFTTAYYDEVTLKQVTTR
ncbi:hypothetical protein JKP88DRAFT_241076 [Tribonema minus]|uniref:Uncharacterized protein n=1 Tax=Tribonema minus TaxID=303371 RepID=A0A835ZCI7_9STRA|nr:hypothetical protein JKP88DRAFT_241076 [Tribonema minus]